MVESVGSVLFTSLRCWSIFSTLYIFNCRVGGKDKPTRFLSYVEAIHGFKHLLKQEDLDKAMSLCTSLKGHLKSKFLVLSDDRILPPYQPKGGKRSHPDSGNQDSVPGKRTQQDHLRRTPGTSVVQQPISVNPTYSAALVPANVAGVSGIQQAQQVVSAPSASFMLPSVAGVNGVHPIAAFPPTFASGVPLAQLPIFNAGAMSVPPPQVVHPVVVPVQTSSGAATGVSQSPSFKTVTSRRGKGKGSANTKNPATAKSTAGQGSVPGRLTPSRAVKVKKSSSQVTSPGPDQYASCEESGDDQGETADEVQAMTEDQQ